MSWIAAGAQAGRLDHVVAGQRVDREAVVGCFGGGDVHLGGEADDGHAAGIAEHLGDVVAVGGLDDDVVRLGVASTAADGGGQVEVELGHVGAGQVVDDGGVGAAEGVEVDAPRRR